MEILNGKTAKQVLALVNTGEVSKADGIKFLTDRCVDGFQKFAAGTGRKPRYASIVALAELEGIDTKDSEAVKAFTAKLDTAIDGKPKAAKKSKTQHAALDNLTTKYVEADVLKLMESKTLGAMVAKVAKGQIKNPTKVANIREAQARLDGVTEPVETKPTSEAVRIDALESKLDKLLALFE